MSESKTLLQFLLDLLNNREALAEFRDDPHAALQSAGLHNVSVDDVKELLPVVLEKVDPAKCAQYEDDLDSGRCHDDAPKHHDHDRDHDQDQDQDQGGRHWGQHGGHDNGWDDDHDRSHQHQDSEIDKVITHLNYVTNNYSYDSHDTVFNTNNITTVWANHSTVDVNNETHNVGASAVSVEGDNNAPIATGGHNVVGDHNQVSGDGSTTSFGSGSALSHVGTGDGGAISVGGPASGNSEHANFQNFGAGNLTAATHAPATSVTSDSHNVTDSQNHTSNDSHNLTDSQNHGSFNPDNSVNTDASNHQHFEDSHNTSTHDDHSQSVDHGHIDSAALLPVL
jgi:hypothetical protein